MLIETNICHNKTEQLEKQALLRFLLIFFLVFGLHFMVIGLLKQPVTVSNNSFQPLRMEVSLQSNPAPPSTTSVSEAKESPKPQPKVHPPQKTPPPVVKQSQETIPIKPYHPVVTAAPKSPSINSGQIRKPYVESDLELGDKINIIPDYPEMAVFLGYQGLVTLKVQVSPQGLSQKVIVESSSGHKILDESALTAIKQWHFMPPKPGTPSSANTGRIRIHFVIGRAN